MHKLLFHIASHQIKVYLAGFKVPQSVEFIYMNCTGENDLSGAFSLLEQRHKNSPVFICIDDMDWNKDLTPWPAPKVFSQGKDFKGEADLYLNQLIEQIIPKVEEKLSDTGITCAGRTIAGYSLAGLFAVYAATRTDSFHQVMSVSGSLWYDGFLDYFTEQMKHKQISRHLEKVYLSVGEKESRTRNVRMQTVYHCTKNIQIQFIENHVKCQFDLNPGNHFAEIKHRMLKGLLWLTGDF